MNLLFIYYYLHQLIAIEIELLLKLNCIVACKLLREAKIYVVYHYCNIEYINNLITLSPARGFLRRKKEMMFPTLAIVVLAVFMSLLLSNVVVVVAQYPNPGVNPLWPLPSSYSLGTSKVFISKSFKFELSPTSVSSSILTKAFSRYQTIIGHRANPADSSAALINKCSFTIGADVGDAELINGVDESYTLSLGSDGDCTVSAPNVWGALHGLETFSQLLARENNKENVVCNLAPVDVSDKARFTHRGMLVDTARHYLSLDSLKKIIDTLPMNKFNVLHWHTVDAESFPLQTPSAPSLGQAVFSPSMVYSMDDLNMITEYAKERGVRVLLELDVPGHAASWNVGMPSVMADCFAKYSYNINDYALNPTLDETFNTVNSILSDLVKATGTKYLHLGGDEVVYGCWGNDTQIVSYMKENNLSYDQLLGNFVAKVDVMANNLHTTAIHWEEVFKANAPVTAGTIFEVWTNATNIQAITAAGYQVIAAPSSYWYLDHSTNSWKVMYGYEPTTNLTQTEAALVIGGEVAMWGELVDERNLVATIYPRASAVSERLWSPITVVDQYDANQRLLIQKCRMDNRGFDPAPLQPGGYCSLVYV